MNKMRERGGENRNGDTWRGSVLLPRQSVRQSQPRQQEPLRFSPHAHGIKSLMRGCCGGSGVLGGECLPFCHKKGIV